MFSRGRLLIDICDVYLLLVIQGKMFTSPHGLKPLIKRVCTKGVIRICKSKDRQHNGQMETDKMTNKYLQNIHIKQRSCNTNPSKNRDELRCSERVAVPATLVTPVVLM